MPRVEVLRNIVIRHDDRTESARVADALREIAGYLSLEPGNGFRSTAYARAADVIDGVPDLAAVARAGGLTSLPGVGRGIAGVVEDLRLGRSSLLEGLRARYPRGAAELAQVLSLAKIRAVHERLGVASLAELREACERGRVRAVPGFGEKSERKLLERIDALAERRDDVVLPEALAQATRLVEHLARHPAVRAVEVAGDLRRRVETIDRLVLVVASDDPSAVAAQLARASPAWSGATVERLDSAGFRLRQPGKLEARVRVASEKELPLALLRATGSSAHLEALATIAEHHGLALDGVALRRNGRKLAVASEAALYERLGLQHVVPELREGAGELEAAAKNALPDDLLAVEDVRGAVHCHTQHSDGKDSIEAMARAAEELGFRYITITDHSQSATYANGLDADRLRRQADEIARVQAKVGVRILHGSEVDILRDGALDFPDDVLRRLDVVVASIHQRHKLDRDAMTERIVRAMRHPAFKIWGHALGRYVLSRPPIECDLDRVFDAIARSRAAIEVNGDPNRLDLAPRWIREARKRSIPFVVSTDAHSTHGLRNVRWAVDMARRGWLRKRDVLNTLDADAFAAAVRP